MRLDFPSERILVSFERYNIDIAEAQVVQAKLFENPVVSLEQNVYNRLNGRYFDFGKQGETIVEVEYFSIDHGTGIVVGQTAIIGNHVRLYQGVTLGAKSFTLDEEGLPIDLPRHPIIEDYVTIYSNASILGRITIGRGSIIGGNIWLTHSVPPNSKISQSRVEEKFTEI